MNLFIYYSRPYLNKNVDPKVSRANLFASLPDIETDGNYIFYFFNKKKTVKLYHSLSQNIYRFTFLVIK